MKNIFLTLMLFVGISFAAPSFPAFDSMVVDEAGILSKEMKNHINDHLVKFDKSSGIQLVVVSVKTLEGLEIEEYANLLFRRYGIGQKDKNNGILLLVAPNEKKVRIEVGYGLEGSLNDYSSNLIIINEILPNFKAKNYEKGIYDGLNAIIYTLKNSGFVDEKFEDKTNHKNNEVTTGETATTFGLVFMIILSFLLQIFTKNSGKTVRKLSQTFMTSSFVLTYLSAGFNLLNGAGIFMVIISFIVIFSLIFLLNLGSNKTTTTGSNRTSSGGFGSYESSRSSSKSSGGFGGGRGGSSGGGGASGSW